MIDMNCIYILVSGVVPKQHSLDPIGSADMGSRMNSGGVKAPQTRSPGR